MRSLPRHARQKPCVHVIGLHKAGCTDAGIAAQSAVSRAGAFDIRKRHTEAGAMALRDAPRGRRKGDGRLLPAAQEATMRTAIIDKIARPVEDAIRALDALGGSPLHRTAFQHARDCPHNGAIPGTLVLHTAKAYEEGSRKITRGDEEMARRGLPEHRPPAED